MTPRGKMKLNWWFWWWHRRWRWSVLKLHRTAW